MHPPPDKTFLCIWNKYFLTEVYSNRQTFDFQMLWECSSWASRNGAVQKYFLTPTRNLFLAVLQEYIFIMLSELRLVKRVRFFAWNCIVKWVTFFAGFCWLWDFLQENLKLIRWQQSTQIRCFILSISLTWVLMFCIFYLFIFFLFYFTFSPNYNSKKNKQENIHNVTIVLQIMLQHWTFSGRR